VVDEITAERQIHRAAVASGGDERRVLSSCSRKAGPSQTRQDRALAVAERATQCGGDVSNLSNATGAGAENISPADGGIYV
jgi:hypothetical protein